MKLAELTPRAVRFGTSIPSRVKFTTETERLAAKRKRGRNWQRRARAGGRVAA